MMDLGESKSIFYFSNEGRINLEKTVELVINRAKELSIKHIIVFTANGDGAFLLKESLTDDNSINIYAATFPYKQAFMKRGEDGNETEIVPGTSNSKIRVALKKQKITLVQGVMPLQDIIIPGAVDVKTQAINYTLSLVSGGMKLCVQSILMATDGGHIEPGENVIAMSADTAIVATSCISTWLFHPQHGLEIHEIICKPNHFTITHNDSKA